MKPVSLPVAAALWVLTGTVDAGVLATFDDLPAPLTLAGTTGLFVANGGSANYQDVIWDSRFRVVGDAYRIAPPGGPLFGVPKSPGYFVTNESAIVDGKATNDALLMTTTLVLTEAWFGQNEYFGFGGGADEITIHALRGLDVLGSVSLVLPDDIPGQPEALHMVDTSAFLSLAGITGYRIDRHAQGLFLDNWVADNFVFQSPVPEPSTIWLLMLGVGSVVAIRCVQARRQRSAGGARMLSSPLKVRSRSSLNSSGRQDLHRATHVAAQYSG